ncbi:hypothetical protein [Piscinibacter sp.]|uniref:hypothetical protein n=1 Tax=Piscinibacter sp. TaxID=1903157 RepID=UPI001D4D63DE|nr:hypothetical protein [Piscinibacter sp.]MBK7529741.1 hypothetical protein [Piscinibacter sp.]
MSSRSYLLSGMSHTPVAVLEAANNVPLLWLGLLAAGATDTHWTDGPTLRLEAGEPFGITLDREAALARLAARRAAIAAWTDPAAGKIVDQFIDLVASQPGEALRLDLSEWVDLVGSREEALAILRTSAAALDSKAGKRRPSAVKRLLDELGLKKLDSQTPAFGVLMAGVACSGSEPWRRDPPRERRAPDDFITWARQADRHFVSATGRVVGTMVTNSAGVQTPVLWDPRAQGTPCASIVPDDIGFLYPHCLSPDGGSLFCGAVSHPGAVPQSLRFANGGLAVLHEGTPSFGVAACSANGDVAAGALYPTHPEPTQAAVWRPDTGVRVLPGVPAGSQVQRVSADGAVMAIKISLALPDGQWSGTRAAIWRHDSAASDTIAAGWITDWVALSQDGHRGALSIKTERDSPARPYFWQAGAEAMPIDIDGKSPEDVVFSPDVGCALGIVDESLVLWRQGQAPEVTMATDGAVVIPRHVSSTGDWWVATLRNPANYATMAILVWERGRGLRRFDAPPSESRLGLGLSVASAAESIDELGLFGQWRDSGEPLTWTPAGGFISWGAPPRPGGASPIDFTPLALAADFAFVDLPQDPCWSLRDVVQKCRAAYPGLRPLLLISAVWCEPCRELEALLHRPALQQLLKGHLLMRTDIDVVGVGMRSIGFDVSAIPVFVPLDEEGRATGKALDSGAWEAMTEQDVIAALAPFLGG